MLKREAQDFDIGEFLHVEEDEKQLRRPLSDPLDKCIEELVDEEDRIISTSTQNTLNSLPPPSQPLIKLEEASNEELPKLELRAEAKQPSVLTGVHFRDWWLRPLFMQKSESIVVIVEGNKVQPDGSLQVWHSSMIATRKTSRILQSSSGNHYFLDGDLDTYRMKQNGYSNEQIELFRDGFPPDWFEYVVPQVVKEKEEESPKPKRRKSAPAKPLKRDKRPIKEDVTNSEDEEFEPAQTRRGREVRKPGAFWDASSQVSRRSRRGSAVVKFEWGTGKVITENSTFDISKCKADRSKLKSKRRSATLARPSLVTEHREKILKLEQKSPPPTETFKIPSPPPKPQLCITENQLQSQLKQSPPQPIIPIKNDDDDFEQMPLENLDPQVNSRPWTTDEEIALQSVLWKLDPKKKDYWGKVALKVGRTPDECRVKFQDLTAIDEQ